MLAIRRALTTLSSIDRRSSLRSGLVKYSSMPIEMLEELSVQSFKQRAHDLPFLAVASHGMSRQGDDRHPLEVVRILILSSNARRLDSSHEGHADVHKNDIVIMLLDGLDCERSVLDDRDAMAS